jgi:hypothetical protein
MGDLKNCFFLFLLGLFLLFISGPVCSWEAADGSEILISFMFFLGGLWTDQLV